MSWQLLPSPSKPGQGAGSLAAGRICASRAAAARSAVMSAWIACCRRQAWQTLAAEQGWFNTAGPHTWRALADRAAERVHAGAALALAPAAMVLVRTVIDLQAQQASRGAALQLKDIQLTRLDTHWPASAAAQLHEAGEPAAASEPAGAAWAPACRLPDRHISGSDASEKPAHSALVMLGTSRRPRYCQRSTAQALAPGGLLTQSLAAQAAPGGR